MWCRDSESTLFLLVLGVHQPPERTLSTKLKTRLSTVDLTLFGITGTVRASLVSRLFFFTAGALVDSDESRTGIPSISLWMTPSTLVSMETSEEDHGPDGLYHESLDEQRYIKSVGSSASACCVRTDLFVLCSAVIHGFADSDRRLHDMRDLAFPRQREPLG
ncbi:hypothetical protein EDB86DRAFT_1270412 [Lactarius hatsudake]|nr:hypothetical protein EDB86DRAFT_1270412 [Lactarius hatsudake]